MSRPTRNRLLVGVLFVGALFASPYVPTVATWVAAAIGFPLVAMALWVTAPFHRARSLLAAKKYDEAATELAAFERALLSSGWKERLAGLAVGLYTSNPIAASRNTLGAVRLEQGRLKDAARAFGTALELDAGYAVPWANRAVLAAMEGDAKAAEDARVTAARLGFSPRVLAKVIAEKLASTAPTQ